MTPEATQLYSMILSLRHCFNQLKAVADQMHHDLGINASMRAVMEAIANGGPKTAPQIARDKGVSRQHIQVNVDALAEQELVKILDNPAHKRSVLIALTRKGKRNFGKIRRREVAVLEQLAHKLSPEVVDVAFQALNTLDQELAQLLGEDNHA